MTRVHSQYTAVETALEDYDRVLAEYRTYSTDWMNDAVDSESPNAALYAAVGPPAGFRPYRAGYAVTGDGHLRSDSG